MKAADAWHDVDVEESACPVCGRESCEDTHDPPAEGPPAPADDREIRILETMEHERVRREARRRLDAETRVAVSLPETLTLRERLARSVEPLWWRIEHWQPRDTRVMLPAQFKGGKTTLVGNLARSLVDGDPFLDRDAATPIEGALAILDTEMSPRQLDNWLGDQHIKNDDRVLPISMRGQVAAFDILDVATRSAWAALLRDRGVAYVILDCLRPILDCLGLDEHHEAGRFLVALDALLLEAGVTECVVVHHMGHAGERSRGDSRLRDWPDVEWRLVRQDSEPSSPRFISAYGRDVHVSESRLDYDPATRRLTRAGGSRRDATAEDALAAVLEVLEASSPLSGRAIKTEMAESEHSKATIDAALRMGTSTGALVAENGPKRAKLYRPVTSVSVSRSVPPVSQDTSVSVPPPIDRRDTGTLDLDASVSRSFDAGGTTIVERQRRS